ncbi:MAG TPA: hypothetical protein VGK67_28045 [Myxococcales bacterium]|jgi:hypothetical protein
MPARRSEKNLLVFAAVLVAVALLRSAWAQVAIEGPVQPDVVGRRFLHLAGRLPAGARVGFLSDLPSGDLWRRRELAQLRYVLSPVRVADDDGTQPWLIQWCASEACAPPPGKIVDRRGGVWLVERGP